MNKPPPGSMCYWRFRGQGEWRFGYCTYPQTGYELVRMGRWNGDSTGGSLVSIAEVEWKPY